MSEAMRQKQTLPRPAAPEGGGAAPTGRAAVVASIQGGVIQGRETERSAGSTPADAATAPPVRRPGPTGASDRVLLVEDNVINQRVAIAMLERLGFCVDLVDNGVEAVIAATMVPYRAILMDCQIPVLNGYEVTKEIRGKLGASRRSPIIAVTSSSTDADRRRCLAAGMDGHLAKPLTLETLATGLAQWAPDLSEPSSAVRPSDARAAAEGDGPVLDAEVVKSLQRLGEEAGEDLLGQLADLFLADADSRIVTLRDALAAEDGPALIHCAHTLCGASANVGAAELARLCAQLATDGTVGELEDTKVLLRSVEGELTRVRAALKEPRPSLSPAALR
jgi:CheY-like chemotaxis protein/HPt (histidine-containing phosphotransfer) domain-containing protein